VFPGDDVPLRLPSSSALAGLLTQHGAAALPLLGARWALARVGVTLEPRSLIAADAHGSWSLVCVARQRFSVASERAGGEGALLVRILPDGCLGPPPREALLGLLHTHARIWRAHDEAACCARLWALPQLRAMAGDGGASGTPGDVGDARDGWRRMGTPTSFSWWLAGELPAQEHFKQRLLEEASTLTRLRLLRRALAEGYACIDCREPITRHEDLLHLAGGAGVNIFVNPTGHTFRVLTSLRPVTPAAATLHGAPSVVSTWWRGYAWTIAACARCHNHLGWLYEWAGSGALPSASPPQSIEEEPPAGMPRTFWGWRDGALGLRLGSLRVVEGEEMGEEEVPHGEGGESDESDSSSWEEGGGVEAGDASESGASAAPHAGRRG